MPELPEVETTRRGIADAVIGQSITAVRVRERRLRWTLAADFEKQIAGQRVIAVARRAKYLLIELERGTVLVHMGMSGSLRVLPATAAVKPHDHVDLELSSGQVVRYNDPRRFGSFHYVTGAAEQHPLLASLGPEPLLDDFDATHLHQRARRRRVAVKQFIMDSHVVVGVGNIYASEALFRAGVRPGRAAGRLKHAELARIVAAIKAVLSEAIIQGGTTLRDYVNTDGLPGYFRQKLYVYERAGEPCRRCGTPIRSRVQGQRATYWCPDCQA